MATLLYVDGLTVSFDGFLALTNLNLILERDEKIRLLIGPNGAGKTTLFDVLTGQVEPVAGRVIFEDRLNLLGLSRHRIAAHALRIIHNSGLSANAPAAPSTVGAT